MVETTSALKFTPNIRRIEPGTANKYDFVSRWRNNWIGAYYLKHLQRHRFVQACVQLVFKYFYLFYVNMMVPFVLSAEQKRWRALKPLSAVVSELDLPRFVLAKSARVQTPMPRVFPKGNEKWFSVEQTNYEFPEIFVTTMTEATLYSGSNLVMTRDLVTCHDLYNFGTDYTSEELHGIVRIDPKRHRIRWLLHDQSPARIPVAATFLDSCAGNYAHWMTEVLPRIVLFCGDRRFDGVPILVDDGLHRNIMDSLLIVAGPEREIITVGRRRALNIQKLYVTSAAGYVPFDRRNARQSSHSHGVFHPIALDRVRHAFDAGLAVPESRTWPKKIYIRRIGTVRNMINRVEIEAMLSAASFEFVEPEKLSFLDQIRLFQNANDIVAPTGAALANAIFCAPGTRVAVIMAKHKNMIYRYWSNMLAPFQIRVSYVLGKITEQRGLGIHGNFRTEPADFKLMLESLGER